MARYPTAPLDARLYDCVQRHPDETAHQLSYRLGLQCSSVSSQLKKMVDAGYLTREDGQGPRGGHVYRVAP